MWRKEECTQATGFLTAPEAADAGGERLLAVDGARGPLGRRRCPPQALAGSLAAVLLIVGALGEVFQLFNRKAAEYRAAFDKPLQAYAGPDLCAARPAAELWPVAPGASIKVKVLTYNLFWWNLMDLRHGMNESAGKLIANSGASVPFDLMGFQECENGATILGDAGLLGEFTLREVHEGDSKDVCLAFRTAAWQELATGHEDVAEDSKVLYYGMRTAQWVRLRHTLSGRTVLFVNHHGPLPVSTGGRCGGRSVAFNLLDLMARNGEVGDLIILVGDFNAAVDSETVQTLAGHLTRIYTGKAFGGIDNVFTNTDPASLILAQNFGNGGSDHDALGATVMAAPGSTAERFLT